MQHYKRWVIYTASFFLILSAALVGGIHLYYMAAILLMLPITSYGLGMLNLRNLVFPVPEPISDIVLSGAERYGFRELPIAATRGSGVDPDGVREYVPGDPLRRMHWKSTARTGKLSVIEFEESKAVNVVLALDLNEQAHAGEGKISTLEYLIRVAASLAQSAIRQGASVRLVANDEPDPAAAAGRGTEHLYAVLGALARAEAKQSQRLSETLVCRGGRRAPGTTLVVLTSGMESELPG